MFTPSAFILYLNTSYVNVNHIQKEKIKRGECNLNTSHVKVNLLEKIFKEPKHYYLNTSNVKVNHCFWIYAFTYIRI